MILKFIKCRLKINTKGRIKEKKIIWHYIFILIFRVELNVDEVFNVLLLVGVEFLPYGTCIKIQKEDSLKNCYDWFVNGGDI